MSRSRRLAKRGDKAAGGAAENGAAENGLHTPRHSARATRNAGQRMRSILLDAASALFKARGLAGTSIAAIASAADAFPTKVTYYFLSKEALFVEAACRDGLHIAERTE